LNRLVRFDLADITPDGVTVLGNQGVPEGATVSQSIHTILSQTMDLFATSARPVGMISELSTGEFESIFRGEGKNEKENPLEQIFPHSDNLALFALTMGGLVSTRIEELFRDNHFAPGSMLDAVASLAADKAVEASEADYFTHLSNRSLIKPDSQVLSYSPGYCGWHISGQRKLFEYLQPEKVGITLNKSFLMSPLKSVTGVLIAGKREIHIFKSNYAFCKLCKTYSCHERMKSLSSA